jgi:CRP/FNR family cyclic AMP-dependent transcriptional regulator
MIGTSRSRVSFFMNKFRKLGFIEYNGKLQVHDSLLNVVLHVGSLYEASKAMLDTGSTQTR